MHQGYVSARTRANSVRVWIAASCGLIGLGLSTSAFGQVTGFGGSTLTGWTPVSNTVGIPNVVGAGTSADVLNLTTPASGQAAAYWFNTPQSITNFSESFTYTDVTHGGADGVAVVWQNNGVSALGGTGGSLGYAGIPTSAALAMNIYSGNSGSGSQYNPTVTSGSVGLTPTPGGVDITSGNPINVSLSYKQSDGALTETMTDTVTNATFTRAWRGISIQSQVGGPTALIGFTGGTGGADAAQSITNFHFTPGGAIATPVAAITPIAATGYNQNMIVSAATGSANITATMDGGTGKGGDTFYETGVNTGANVAGVAHPGAVFGSATDANHTFVLQPNGAGQNDAVMLDAGNTAGTLSLTGPAAYKTLSFLVTAGNGGAPIGVTVHYAGGGSQTGTITGPDWFNNSNIALDANGRADVALDDFNSTTNGNPRMYQQDFTLTDTTDAVQSIDFAWQGGTGGDREAVFGISGQAVPEPATLGLFSLGAIGLFARRRRTVGA
jgi:hypothetical protein